MSIERRVKYSEKDGRELNELASEIAAYTNPDVHFNLSHEPKEVLLDLKQGSINRMGKLMLGDIPDKLEVD